MLLKHGMEFGSDLLKSWLVHFGWRTALDTAVISAGIYILYRTFRSSGSLKVVAGTFIAGAVFILANFLELEGIRWIYSNLSSIILIALVVVFQPELRKIFERTASLYRRFDDKGDELADILPETVFELAERKWGGLIVLPENEPIASHISGGIEADAIPSYSLLMSIFDPHSPGHDGAAIIQNGRISYYGVRLPISDSDRLPPEYGTRHHAAMGISELSDCLVILISEERGRAVIFQNGMMHPLLEKDDLKKTILLHQQKMKGTSDIFKFKKFKRRFAILEILAAVVLAFFVRFFMIVPPQEPRIAYNDAPVEVQFVGEMKEGLAMEEVQIRPRTIKIIQNLPAKSIVLKTSPVYLNNILTDTLLHVSLLAPPGIHPAQGYWPEIEIVLRVRSRDEKTDNHKEKHQEAELKPAP